MVRENALAASEAHLGLSPESRPRVRAGPRASDRRYQSCGWRRRWASSARERARVRQPCERHVRWSVTAKSRPAFRRRNSNGVMRLAQPDRDAVSKRALEGLPARAIQANRTDRSLERYTTCLVETGEISHPQSLTGAASTTLCHPGAGSCQLPIGTRRECHSG